MPGISFPFPGGFLIGGAMLANLLAAHSLRFKIQTHGLRRLAGLAIVALGAALTWLVIASGSNAEGLQGLPTVEYSTLWAGFKLGLAALWLVALAALVKLDSARRLERVGLAVVAAVAGAVVAWLYLGSNTELGDSSMRILWQLLKGGLAGVVLLAGCVLLFRKRAGIVLLHGGVALMMSNELVVYGLHSEGQMHIREGETVNYVQDIRDVELAVVDPADPSEDVVVAVPESVLQDSERISDAGLPFDIELVRYFDNSNLRALKPDEKTPADAGTGQKYTVDAVRPGSGTDTESAVDMAAAYVRFLDKRHGERPLGTYLVSLHQSMRDLPEKVTVDGKTYDVYLRFKRNTSPIRST